MNDTGGTESSVEALGDRIAELSARINAATARLLGLVSEFDERKGWEALGFGSCALWLHWRCGTALVTAHEHVRVARALRSLPLVAKLFGSGEMSYSKVRTITRIAEPATEEALVAWSRHGTASQLARIAAGYRRARALQHPDQRHRLRAVTWDYDDEGCLVIKARLTPEEGAVVIGALQRAVEEIEREDAVRDQVVRGRGSSAEDSAVAARDNSSAEDSARSAIGAWAAGHASHPTKQRAADALVRMAEAFDEGAPVGVPKDSRALVIVHTDDPSLTRHRDVEQPSDPGTPVRAHLADQSSIHPETLLRLACDAGVIRVHTPSMSFGRRTRTVPRGLRRLLIARDRSCRFPGCINRRADAHHIVHWAHGGSTSMDNLVLLCRRHHRSVHEGRSAISLDGDGRVSVTNATGDVIPAVPHQPHIHPDEVSRLTDARIGPWTGSTAADWKRAEVGLAASLLLSSG